MDILFEGRLMLCVCVNKIYQIELDKAKVIWIKSKRFLKNEEFNKDSKWLHICNFSRMYIISLLWGKNAPFGPILPSNLFKCRIILQIAIIAIWHLYLFGWLESWEGLLFATDIIFNNLCGSHLQSRVIVLVSWKFKNPGEGFDWWIGIVAIIGKHVMWLWRHVHR